MLEFRCYYSVMNQRQNSILVLAFANMTSFPVQSAAANTVEPLRTFSFRAEVAIRETVAATVVGNNRINLLITDRAPTGRSGILLNADSYGRDQKGVDLKGPAHGLVQSGSLVKALAPVLGGIRLLEPSAGDVHTVDLTGVTAATTGSESHLVRLLGTGDIAVHSVAGRKLAASRLLPTAAEFKVQGACATCGNEKLVTQGAYVLCSLPGNRVAATHRSSARLKVVDLNTGKVLLSVDLDNEDLRRGRAMFARQQEALLTVRANPSNPSLVLSGAAHSSGDMFFLIGPFAPSEGARVIRVTPNGAVVSSIRCSYSAFKPENGPPQFLGINEDDLYLISSRGHVNVYSIANSAAPSQR